MIRNFRFNLISITLILIVSGFQNSAQYLTETFFLEHEGLERTYEVFVPENYDINKQYPLVFILHGGGGTGKGIVRMTRARFNKLAGEQNFIAVYPNGYGKSWKEINQCSEKKDLQKIPDKNKSDDCIAEKTSWINPENKNIKVVEIKIKNGGHTWPGTRQYLPQKLIGNTNRDFNGCDEIWNFF